MPRRNAGDPFQVPPAGEWNGMVGAGEEYNERRSLGNQSTSTSRIVDPTRIDILNNTGSDILNGRALEIGDKLLTTIDRQGLWFTGGTPAPDGTKLWGVCELPILTGGIGKLIIAGAAVSRVTINDADHRWADVVSSSTTLQTAWHGVPILYKPSGTGTVDAVLLLGSIQCPELDCVITQSGGIAGGSSGTANVKWNGSTVDSITVYNDWMDGSQTVGENAEARFRWQPDRQKYVLVGADCT